MEQVFNGAPSRAAEDEDDGGRGGFGRPALQGADHAAQEAMLLGCVVWLGGSQNIAPDKEELVAHPQPCLCRFCACLAGMHMPHWSPRMCVGVRKRARARACVW